MRYGLIGTTDDVTVCDCCGKQGLKRTVILSVLDDEGGDNNDYCFFGSTCAENALYNNNQSKTASKVKGKRNRVTLFQTQLTATSDLTINLQIEHHSATGFLQIRNLDNDTECPCTSYSRVLEACKDIPEALQKEIRLYC